MNQQLLPSPMRTIITALVLTCTINQHSQCANNAHSNWGNTAQFGTAFLTLPTGLAAQAKPDSKGLALLKPLTQTCQRPTRRLATRKPIQHRLGLL